MVEILDTIKTFVAEDCEGTASRMGIYSSLEIELENRSVGDSKSSSQGI